MSVCHVCVCVYTFLFSKLKINVFWSTKFKEKTMTTVIPTTEVGKVMDNVNIVVRSFDKMTRNVFF